MFSVRRRWLLGLFVAATLAVASPDVMGSGLEFDVSASLMTRAGWEGNRPREELLVDPDRWREATDAEKRQLLVVLGASDLERLEARACELPFIETDAMQQLRDDGAFWLLFAAVEMELGVGDDLSFLATVDSGVIRYGELPRPFGDVQLPSTDWEYSWTVQGREPEKEARHSGFVRELALRWQISDEVTLRAGKRRVRLADGWVYDDFGVGVSLAAALGELDGMPLSASADVLLPARDWVSDAWTSPIAAAALTLEFSPLESVRIEAAYYHDALGAFGATMQSATVAQAALENRDCLAFRAAVEGVGGTGDFGWVAAAADVLLGDVLLHGRVIVTVGAADIRIGAPEGEGPAIERSITVVGAGGEVRAEWLLAPEILLEPFVVVLSGDGRSPFLEDGEEARYTGYVGIVPYWTFTNLFFQGGLNESFSQRGAAAAGVAGFGVVAAGFAVTSLPHDDVMVRWRGTQLWAVHAIADTGSRVYGLEFDLEARWQVTERFAAALELDVLFPGEGLRTSEPFWKAMGGLEFVY